MPAAIAPQETASVSVDVTNTGSVPGEEIVQLYVHDVVSLPTRPVKELKDFVRVALKPGETRSVSFRLTPDKLASMGLDMRRAVQPGAFEIMVGTNSADVLTSPLMVQ
jgi:beta-glucosidase